jgi:chorismate mutase
MAPEEPPLPAPANTPAPSDATDLNALRSRIDAIDAALLDLLQERVATVLKIGQAKKGAPVFRPEREATIMRGLLDKNTIFPEDSLIKIWRELLGAAVNLQGSVKVAYCPSEDTSQATVRNHFGITTALAPKETHERVANSILDKSAAIGIVSRSEGFTHANPWWSGVRWHPIGQPATDGLFVVACLPFLQAPHTPVQATSYALTTAVPQASASADHTAPTESDTTVLMVTTSPDLSRAGLQGKFQAAGFQNVTLIDRALCADAPEGTAQKYLLEIAGFHSPEYDKFQAIYKAAPDTIYAMHYVGAFATPAESKSPLGTQMPS